VNPSSANNFPRYPWYRSLSAKLFLLVAVCLTATVALVSWENGRLFGKTLDRQVEAHAADKVRESAAAITGVIEGWQALIALAVHSLLAESDLTRRNGLAQAFVGANKELLSLSLYRGTAELASAFHDDAHDLRLEDQKAADLASRIHAEMARWVAEFAADSSSSAATDSSLRVRSLQGVAKLPLAALAMRFKQSQQQEPLWAVLVVWQDRIAAALPRERQIRSALIGEGDTTVVSIVPQSEDGAAARTELKELVGIARRFPSTSGYTALGEPELGRSGAFAKLRHANLLVVASRDARPGQREVQKQIIQTALWACVFLLGAILLTYLSVAGVMRNLKRVTEATLRIAAGDFSSRLNPASRDEIATLSHAVDHMSGKIVDLMQQTAQAARQEKELETAKAMQSMLFPPDDIVDEGVIIRGRYQVASECGGDWWWHYKTDDGKHLIMIADVTGHGASAALVTAMAHTACTMLQDTLVLAASASYAVDMMTAVNRVLWKSGHGKATMTALLMLLDPKTGEVLYSSAGHTWPFLITNKMPGHDVDGRRVKLIKCSGTPLGLSDDAVFTEHRMCLGHGDRMVLYTDGLLDCTNTKGQAWPRRKLEKLLGQLAESGEGNLVDPIMRAAFAHYSGHPLADDITLVAIEWLGTRTVEGAA